MVLRPEKLGPWQGRDCLRALGSSQNGTCQAWFPDYQHDRYDRCRNANANRYLGSLGEIITFSGLNLRPCSRRDLARFGVRDQLENIDA